ncbi:MAG: hypothetical protein HQK83_19690, partial [Fibrobacteria bacterium]|nr:hypothetical protein [Fibrobacteria bacterium]
MSSDLGVQSGLSGQNSNTEVNTDYFLAPVLEPSYRFAILGESKVYASFMTDIFLENAMDLFVDGGVRSKQKKKKGEWNEKISVGYTNQFGVEDIDEPLDYFSYSGSAGYKWLFKHSPALKYQATLITDNLSGRRDIRQELELSLSFKTSSIVYPTVSMPLVWNVSSEESFSFYSPCFALSLTTLIGEQVMVLGKIKYSKRYYQFSFVHPTEESAAKMSANDISEAAKNKEKKDNREVTSTSGNQQNDPSSNIFYFNISCYYEINKSFDLGIDYLFYRNSANFETNEDISQK